MTLLWKNLEMCISCSVEATQLKETQVFPLRSLRFLFSPLHCTLLAHFSPIAVTLANVHGLRVPKGTPGGSGLPSNVPGGGGSILLFRFFFCFRSTKNPRFASNLVSSLTADLATRNR